MPALTRVPQVVDALIEIFTAAVPDTVQVLDGPVIGEVMHEALCVGLAADQTRTGYDSTVTEQEGYGRPRYVEQWTVSSMLTLWNGGSRIVDLRSRAGELLTKIDDALREQQTRDGVWQRVGFGGQMQWLPLLHEDGATVSVFFDVVGASIL